MGKARGTGIMKYVRKRVDRRLSWYSIEKLLRILFASECIPAAMAKSLGQRIPPCGKCSACRKGSTLKHIPHFHGMKAWQLRLWFLRWQRAKLAEERGCAAEQLIPDAALGKAAQRLVFPEGTDAPPELERLLAYFRGKGMHDPRSQRIE